MDSTNSLTYHNEEHFSIFQPNDYSYAAYENEETEFNTLASSENEWELETELNGDIGLIPMSSDLAMTYLSHSPPKEDFQKTMGEWQNFMNIEVPSMEALTTNILLPGDEDIVSSTNIFSSPLPSVDMPTFNSPDFNKPKFKYPKSVGKKIDMKAQCYITEQKQSPIHNAKQEDSSASDTELDIDSRSNSPDSNTSNIKQNTSKIEPANNDNCEDSENDFVDVDTVPEFSIPILEAKDVNSLLEQFEATETTILPVAAEKSSDQPATTPTHTPNNPYIDTIESQQPIPGASNQADKNKQILNALPQELIKKIKASSKRKVIPVIDPIPNKRRAVRSKPTEIPNKIDKTNSNCVQREHDYCSLLTPYPKYPKKDSGFESAEEDEQRNILRNQLVFKGANGKMMVSLLKVNTIRNNPSIDNTQKKRILNLEEYKRRREGLIRSCDTSQSNSPSTSGRNTPEVVEDNQTRLQKHQQKLMRMAAEVLKTAPKSARQIEQSPSTKSEQKVQISTTKDNVATPPPTPSVPENVEVITLVSIGVNTDSQMEVPPTELEEIKPILRSANGKISNNSLITSVIENIQNKKKTRPSSVVIGEHCNKHVEAQVEVLRENKTIIYREKYKNPPVINTVTVAVQTETNDVRRHRNCDSRSVTSNHRKSHKRRSSSSDSSYSYSSWSSSTSSSSGRSRSPSPSTKNVLRRKQFFQIDQEHLREVQERRIVYVGGIGPYTTKESLRRRFQKFGVINNVSVHIKRYGINYGFVTFAYKDDAYEAIEHGNDDPTLPTYDLRFGGRRIFCGANYSDLDNVECNMNYQPLHMEESFDSLLREVQAQLRKRKSCQ